MYFYSLISIEFSKDFMFPYSLIEYIITIFYFCFYHNMTIFDKVRYNINLTLHLMCKSKLEYIIVLVSIFIIFP